MESLIFIPLDLMAKLVVRVKMQILTTGKLSSRLLVSQKDQQRRLRRRPSLGNEKGFTLMELLVVVALISIMLAVSIPALRGSLFVDPLKSSSRKIIGLVKGVREKAVRDQRPFSININLEEGVIWYDEIPSQEDEEKRVTRVGLPVTIQVADVWTKSGGKVSFGAAVVWVDKRGYMDQTIIHLGDEDTSQLSIVFSPFLGSIKVYDEYVSVE